jgi:hypothetical protein
MVRHQLTHFTTSGINIRHSFQLLKFPQPCQYSFFYIKIDFQILSSALTLLKYDCRASIIGDFLKIKLVIRRNVNLLTKILNLAKRLLVSSHYLIKSFHKIKLLFLYPFRSLSNFTNFGT